MTHYLGSKIRITATDGIYIGIVSSMDQNHGRISIDKGKIDRFLAEHVSDNLSSSRRGFRANWPEDTGTISPSNHAC